ncbi:MoaA/NifB/PqqE/SkfB family radical SAM enzyme [Clostridium tetanomorphum]|uniref:Radical SAM protein n=1 Tax=Clostridium tetanomorphum TaxID=1553 RepID=A0A923J2D9_CLOTT|nr:radical SAM protein [Clostridium tetanomorphum]KAJ53306.1 fe-S oxidoreductase [Clostridium tetanomorphum DSM 665]MBC2400167.1 radical SAM protein [Clostridium tetanomorphum]MBP1865662.1 MoaA/NifB/PqqE/SkfB family radical SAM enzyme [Clostridium tetanomorphum]NRS86782.1 MoaA/NifB/PqqE/SkfB family radical SAM enzyme [Clostridium tetanomorphum]NRZ99463.1 MoaA/NifB/PqqE/SkfB family radical SAM enzyme [Clostridium tetanomorphum]
MSVIKSMEKGVKDMLVKRGAELLSKNPEKNVDKLFDIVKKTVKDEENLERVNNVYKYYKEIPSVNEYIQNILKTTDKKCMQKLFTNFFSNAVWYGMPKRAKLLEEEGIKTPFVILLSPSMRCNLRCVGCYAANYSKEDDIPYEEVDRIVKEARDIGIYYFVILGGEPFFNEYMLDIYEKYNDVMFTPFTNGTLFDEKLADKIKDLGNVIPMFSIEGFEKETDMRRGKGVFSKVMHGMDLLRERGVLFGVSTATGRHNVDTVTSDEFIDMLIEKGARMGWYFIFMPVGDNPDFNMMLTPEQRLMLGEKVRKIRNTKPYFAIDFFNDAPYVGGCIAGKYYCHINSNEDVEPCIFAHFATDNLKGKSLLDVFKGPFFKELRDRQPYNDNLLLPCMMIDNPEVVREVIAKTGAKPTDKGADMMINDEEFKRNLNKLAEEFKPYAEKAWKEEFNSTGNYEMSKG